MTRLLPQQDLDHVLTFAQTAFESLRDAHIFITGGTGFFGHWLLESLLHANHRLGLDARVTVLTRSASRFRARAPHIIDDPTISLLEGDAATFAFPSGHYTHILHAATDSTGAQSSITEADLAQSILRGTEHILRFADQAHTQRFLYVSSGAVYGRGISDVRTIPEGYPLPPRISPPENYDQAKLLASALCLTAGRESGMAVSVAQCFAFVGPHLPLDAHFAIGNFIRDALAHRPIHIKGDGTPLRSFLYMSDLAIWLWTILAQAAPQSVYNVGSDESVSIAELAHLTARTLNPTLPIQIDGTPDPTRAPATYVPDITRARTELGLEVRVPLAEAIRKTADWNR